MPTGNVGIGTTAPMSKLHVIGSEIVSQTLGIGTSIARATLHVGGDTLVEGHILPSQCNIYNLGSPEARFKDLYISDATIDINGLELKSLTGNTLYVVGNQLQTFPSATQTFAYTSTSNIEYPPPVPLLAFELDNAISPIQSIHSETYGVYAAINGQDEQSEYRVWANSIRNYGEVNEQSPYFAFDQNPNTRWESIVSLQYGQDPSGPFTTPTLTIQLPAPIVLYTYAITIRADAGYLGQSPMKWRVYGLVSVGATPTLIETRTLPSESWSHPGETRIFLNATPSPSSFPIYQFEFLQTVGTNSVSIANITLYARHVFDINVEHHDHVRKLIHSSGNFTEHSIETILSPSLELPTTNMAVRLEASSFNKYADASASTPVQIRTWNSAFCYATPESQLPMLHVNGGYNNGAFIDLISESGHFIHLPVFQLTSSFIITAFFKFVGTPGPLFDLGNGVLDNNVVLSLKENNHLELAIYNGASLTHTITSLEVELSNEWILITVLADSETIKIAQTTAEGSKIIANSVVLQPIPVIPRKAARVGASHIASSTGTTGTSMQLGAFYIFTDSIPDYQLVLIYKYIWDAGKATRTTTDAGLRTFIESNRLSSFASEQLATSTTPSKYHFTYPNGFVSLDQKHHGNITFSDTVTVGKDVEIHGHMMSSNVTVVGTLTTSNLNVLNQFYYNYDSEMVRTNLQAQPITRTLQVTSDTMQSQEFLIDGIFTFSPNKAHVCVNGIKLAYLSSSNHDYNVTYNIAYDQAKTLVTVALMQPIYRGDVFDVTLWPELLYEDSELRPGLLTQNIEINPSQWLLQLSTSNLTFSGNVGIGRRLDVGQGLAAVSEDALVRLNLQQPWAFRPYENQLQFFAEEFGTAFSIVNSLNENIATFASRGYESINLNGVGIGTTVPIQPLHVHGASFLNGNVGIGTAQATHALHVHGHVKANDIYAEKVFSKNSFATLSDLPSATQYPGMFAYVVGESNAYVAAVDSWKTIAPDVATVPTPTPAAPVIHASWTFASGSGTSYSVTGSGITPDNTENPTFYVVRGLRYSWTNATASHPVELVMDDGSPILATTLLTSSGATSSIASEGETLTFEIPLNAPTGNTYRYKCTVHAPMTGVLSVV